MNGLVNIYQRDEQIIIAPCAGGGGVSYEIEPVVLVPPLPDQVGAAITASLQFSAGHMGKPVPNLRDYRSPVLARVRLRSLRQFYRNIAFCSVYRDQDTVLIQPYRPARDGKGFELHDGPQTVADPALLGEAVLQILNDLPRLNPVS
jgi:hypothetical protein